MKGKILVIEDDPIWQDDLKEFLELDGFHVDVVGDIESALKIIEMQMFHFVTLDMRLDKLSKENLLAVDFEGWDILGLIKKIRLEQITPVMVVTSFAEDYERLKPLKKLESFFYMEKRPFMKKEFLEIINREVARIDLRFKNDFRSN